MIEEELKAFGGSIGPIWGVKSQEQEDNEIIKNGWSFWENGIY